MFHSLINAFKIYQDRRMVAMLALGFSSGFPLALVVSTLTLWLKDSGIALATIGALSLIKTPFSFKWAWAPLVDRVKLPLLSRLGQRRSWAILSQIMLFLGIMGMASINLENGLSALILFAFIVVLSSATQDIVLDAYRIDIFNQDEQAASVAVFTLGYRFGMIFSGAGALFLSDIMSWNKVYTIMAFGAWIGILTILCIKEPESKIKTVYKNVADFIKTAVVEPLADFLKRPYCVTILAFIFFYRMSDAYMGQMAYVFYDDLGFSKTQIAAASKIYGMIATIAGGFIGGMVMNKLGIYKGLFWCGILQSITNFIYVLQAQIGNHFAMLCTTIAFDNIAGGMATIAFVAYLSSLCNKKYTATQYALLSSLMTLARDIFAATSGWLAASVSWETFFILTVFMGVPGLLLLWRLWRIEKKVQKN